MVKILDYFEKEKTSYEIFIFELVIYFLNKFTFATLANMKRETLLKKIKTKYGKKEEYGIIEDKKKLSNLMNVFFSYRTYRQEKSKTFTKDDFIFLSYLALIHIKIVISKDFNIRDLEWIEKLTLNERKLGRYFWIFLNQGYIKFTEEVKYSFKRLYKYPNGLSKFHTALYDTITMAVLHMIEIFKKQSYLEFIDEYDEEED